MRAGLCALADVGTLVVSAGLRRRPTTIRRTDMKTGMFEERSGWVTFAGVMLVIGGSLNVIYGLAAIGGSRAVVNNAHYVFSNLNTWGWVLLVVGLVQVLAAGSLWNGGMFGRIIGVAAAGVSAVVALLSIPTYPFWSLVIFALDIIVIQQICAKGAVGRGADSPARPSAMEGMAEYRQ
jgi:hypothetical protein